LNYNHNGEKYNTKQLDRSDKRHYHHDDGNNS